MQDVAGRKWSSVTLQLSLSHHKTIWMASPFQCGGERKKEHTHTTHSNWAESFLNWIGSLDVSTNIRNELNAESLCKSYCICYTCIWNESGISIEDNRSISVELRFMHGCIRCLWWIIFHNKRQVCILWHFVRPSLLHFNLVVFLE